MNRPGGSGRFTTLQNRSPQMIQQYQQQTSRLRTPNYSPQNGHHHQSHVSNSSRGSGRGGSHAPSKPSQQRPNYPQQPSKSQNQHQNYKEHHQNHNMPSSSNPKNNVDNVQILEQYFSQNNLGELTFKTATMEMKAGGGNNPKNKAKKVTRFVSTVRVGESNFQTFPNSFVTKEQAEDAAAAMAISKLNINSHNSTNNNR